MGTAGIKDKHTASLYELAFTAKRSVSGQNCEVMQRTAQLVAHCWMGDPGIKAGALHLHLSCKYLQSPLTITILPAEEKRKW